MESAKRKRPKAPTPKGAAGEPHGNAWKRGLDPIKNADDGGSVMRTQGTDYSDKDEKGTGHKC
jgi:hypothetical protein